MKTTTRALYVCLLLLSSTASADWSKEDMQRQGIFTAELAIDWYQTQHTRKHPDKFMEDNWYLDDYPTKNQINNYFLSVAIVHPIISHALPPVWRKHWQNISISVQTGVIVRNYYVRYHHEFK